MNLGRQLEHPSQVVGKAFARLPLVDHEFLKADMKDLKFNGVIEQQDKVSIQVVYRGE